MKYLRESIILRLLCVCITLSWSIPFKASADSFPGCLIENPCDCECDDYREMWPSTVKTFHGQDIQPQMNSGASNCVCPPYNKDTGRVNCLKNPAGVGYPPIWDIIYMNICAEQSPNSNYFAPSIRYRTQICNLGCWTLHGDLTGDGECTVLPSSFGIPTIRICARMAKPAVPASGTPGDINYIAGKPADPGYTPDVNLDFEGYLVDDNPLSNGGYDVNGNPMSTPNAHLQSPKICLYWDPDLLDTLLSWSVVSYNIKIMTPIILGLAAEVRGGNTDPSEAILEMLDPDLMDLNPVQQPNHNDGAINPIFQLLISMTKGVAGLANSLANMIDSIPDYIQYSMMPLVVIEYTLKLGVWILDNIGVEVLKIIGTVNRVVISSFGCVNVPLGPFPPPYCQPLAKTLALPTTYEICPTSVMNDGVTTLVQQSTTSDPCAIAGVSCNPSCWVTCEANNTCDQCTPPTPYGLCVKPLTTASRNNVINNSIRVGFNDYKSLCNTSDPDDTEDGTCVIIHGPLTASLLNASNGGAGTLPLCSSMTPNLGSPSCIVSKYLSNQCNTITPKPWYCAGGIRVAYSNAVGNNMATDYYDSLTPDCPLALGKIGACQAVFGINLGSYADLVVQFPTVEPSNDPTHDVAADTNLNSAPIPPSYRVSDVATITDATGIARQFQAVVVRENTHVDKAGLSPQEPAQICAYEISQSGAGGSYVAIGCNDRATFPKPQVYDCKTDSSLCTSSFFNPAMIVELAVPVSDTTTDTTKSAVTLSNSVNLAGHDYGGYATDSTFAKQPFYGSHVILNPKSIYGNYINDAAPYDALWNLNANAVYLNGLEYLNGTYEVGAENFCLTGYVVDDCASGQTRQNCVLSELINSSIISCTTFREFSKAYPGIDVCIPGKKGTVCDYNNPVTSYKGGVHNENTVDIISCSTTSSVNVGGAMANTTSNSYCYNYTMQSNVQYPNIPMCDTTNTDIACNYASPASSYYDNNGNIVNVLACQSMASPPVASNCYQMNQPLCQISYNGNGRLVPPTNTNSALPNGYIPNVDYYNYTPGISASPTQATPDIASNSSIYNSVISAAQSTFSAPSTTTYSVATCTNSNFGNSPNTAPYNSMMQYCATARGSSDKVNSICTETLKLATDHTSTLYKQLSDICTSTQSTMTHLLTDQYQQTLLSTMQVDATSAQSALMTLMSVINGFSDNPGIVKNIIKTEQGIYNSTDTSTYPVVNGDGGAAAKIAAICTQTQALVVSTASASYPTVSAALASVCQSAQASKTASSALATLNTAIGGFTQYDVSNNGATVTNNSLVPGYQVAMDGGYTPPDFSSMTIRNRTDVENGVCIDVPQPTCPAIITASAITGNATWTEASIGSYSTGTCASGYIQSDLTTTLQAYCLLDRNAQTVALDSNIVQDACVMESGITNIVITQDFSAMHNNPTFGSSVQSTGNHSASIKFNTHNTSGAVCDNGVCVATSTVTFNVGDVCQVNSFILSNIGVDDFAKVEVNGALVYSVVGGAGAVYYDVSQIQNIGYIPKYTAAQGGLPLVNQMWETNGFATLSPNLDITPYLVEGQNTIVITLYIIGGGALAYDFDYKDGTNKIIRKCQNQGKKL